MTGVQTCALPILQGMGLSPQTSQATGMAGLAGTNAMNAGNTYQQVQGQGTNFYQAPNQQVNTQNYTGQNVQQYMNPYLQTAQNQAISNYANSLPQLGSSASNVGGLGGSREALMQAQAQQGLQQTMAGNVNNAFQNAQNQFNTQQQANLQAQQANQQAALQQAAQAAQYGLGGQQLAQQSQQFGANLGLQGQNAAMNAANILGNLGQNQYGQQMGILSGLNQFGTQQQNTQQAVNNALNQNFQNYVNYPYAQMAFLSGILHGTSPGALGSQGTTSTYAQAPNVAGQLAGLGVGAAGLTQAMGSMGGKKGGKVYDDEYKSGIAHAYANLGD